MLCKSCIKKCNNEHCSYSYTLIEACKSGKPFREIGTIMPLEYVEIKGFKYIKYLFSNEVYTVTREDFFKEYELFEQREIK